MFAIYCPCYSRIRTVIDNFSLSSDNKNIITDFQFLNKKIIFKNINDFIVLSGKSTILGFNSIFVCNWTGRILQSIIPAKISCIFQVSSNFFQFCSFPIIIKGVNFTQQNHKTISISGAYSTTDPL